MVWLGTAWYGKTPRVLARQGWVWSFRHGEISVSEDLCGVWLELAWQHMARHGEAGQGSIHFGGIDNGHGIRKFASQGRRN
jgi:hypothetical protein